MKFVHSSVFQLIILAVGSIIVNALQSSRWACDCGCVMIGFLLDISIFMLSWVKLPLELQTNWQVRL